MSATPLTFSMEDIHICDSVCLRYVDDKKLSVLQSNVKYLKLKKYLKKIFKFWFYGLLSEYPLLVSMKIIYILHTNCLNVYISSMVSAYYSKVKVKILH